MPIRVTIVEFSPNGKSIISAATPEGGDDEVKVIGVENVMSLRKAKYRNLPKSLMLSG